MVSKLTDRELACIREESARPRQAMAPWKIMEDQSCEQSSTRNYNNFADSDDQYGDGFSDKPPHEAPTSESNENQQDEAEMQSQLMSRYRSVLLVGIVAVLLICTFGGYFLAKRRDRELFQREFQLCSKTLVSSIKQRVDEHKSSLESLSTSLTSYAEQKSSSWPYVTVENSGRFLSNVLSLSPSDGLTILPIVDTDQRLLWEVYSTRLQGWM